MQAAGAMADRRWKQAARACRTFIRKNPRHLPALEMLVQCQWHLADLEAVIRTAKRLLRLNSYEPGYLLLRGMAYQALGCCGSAGQDFQRAMSESKNPVFRQRVSAAIEILDEWQAELVAQLLALDDAFDIAFSLDPVTACRQRGFEFSWTGNDGGSRSPQPTWESIQGASKAN